jgi:branched-chain amino acid transport system permease protein
MGVSELLQAIFTGLTNGAVYGVIGVGFVVIHRITGVINFAQGDFAVAGAFAVIVFAGLVPLWLAVALGMAVAALISVLLFGAAVYPLRKAGLLVQTIVTLGAAIVVRSVIQLIFGTQPYQLPAFTSGAPIRISGASLTLQTLWLVGGAIAIWLLLSWFFERTLLGKAVTACAVNRYAAGIVGINPDLMAALSFALSGAIAGGIAATQTPLTFMTVSAGLALSLNGFVASVLGGLEKIGTTIIGGFLLGILEAATAIFVSSQYQGLISLALLLTLLVFRPSGLTRARTVARA